MRKQASLMFVSMFMTACSVNTQSCKYYPTGGWGDQPQGKQALPAPADHGTSETDTVAIVSTNSGTFAVAAIRPANEIRVYRVDASDMDQDPLAVRFVGSMQLDAPAHVTADDQSHARVTLADGTTVTIDPQSLSLTDSSTGNAAQRDGSVAYALEGDAWLDDTKVGAPGLTRSVALADVSSRRVLVLQTVEPRMLVFYTTKDLTMPAAFEPLD
jgi:hypothetical protein